MTKIFTVSLCALALSACQVDPKTTANTPQDGQVTVSTLRFNLARTLTPAHPPQPDS